MLGSLLASSLQRLLLYLLLQSSLYKSELGLKLFKLLLHPVLLGKCRLLCCVASRSSRCTGRLGSLLCLLLLLLGHWCRQSPPSRRLC